MIIAISCFCFVDDGNGDRQQAEQVIFRTQPNSFSRISPFFLQGEVDPILKLICMVPSSMMWTCLLVASKQKYGDTGNYPLKTCDSQGFPSTRSFPLLPVIFVTSVVAVIPRRHCYHCHCHHCLQQISWHLLNIANDPKVRVPQKTSQTNHSP